MSQAKHPETKRPTRPIVCRVYEMCDCYTGTRKALLHAGAAKPEWFAEIGMRWQSTKRTKRSFYGVEGGSVTLRDHADGTFTVYVHCHEAERSERRAESSAFAYTKRRPPSVATAKDLAEARADRAYQGFLKNVL